MYILLPTLLLFSPDVTESVSNPPSIYKWIADSPYICNPARQSDGSMVNFLHEEDGEVCNKCDHIVADFVATHACGIRINGNEVDSRIGCFELPSLCVEEYVLRYSNFFTNQGKITGPLPVEKELNRIDAEEEEEFLTRSRLRKEKELLASLPDPLASTATATSTQELPITANDLSNAVQGGKSGEGDADNSHLPFDTRTFERMNTDIERRLNTRNEEEGQFLLLPIDGSISEGSAKKQMERNLSVLIDKKLKGQRELVELIPASTRLLMLQKRKETFFGTTTTTSTLPTTTTKKPCLDKNNLCCFWAVSGECDTNPFWMRINCAKTCGTCECSLKEADFCVSTGINCTIPTTTTTTTKTTTTTTRPTTTIPTTRPQPPTTRIRQTRPFTPPKNGFARTRSTLSTSIRTTTPVYVDEVVTNPYPLYTKSTPYTTRTTPPTTTTMRTTTPDPCQNLHNMCEFWASLGECTVNPFWMRPHCPRSCRSCGEKVDTVFAPTPRKGCANTHKFCNFWASTGECEFNPNWMVPNCPLSCRIC